MLLYITLIFCCAASAKILDLDYEDKIEEIQHAVCKIATEEVQATANATITRQLKGICTSRELTNKLERLEARLSHDLQAIKTFLRIDESNEVAPPYLYKRHMEGAPAKEFVYFWRIENAVESLDSDEILSNNFHVSGNLFYIKLITRYLGPKYCGLELRTVSPVRRQHRFVIVNQSDSKLDVSSQILGNSGLNLYRLSSEKIRRFIHRDLLIVKLIIYL